MFTDVLGYRLTSRRRRPPGNIGRITGIPGARVEVAHLHRDGMVGVELITYLAPHDRGAIEGRPCDTGFVHLTYSVTDIEAVIAAAAAHGWRSIGEIIVSQSEANPGAMAAYLRDADGLALELIQPA